MQQLTRLSVGGFLLCYNVGIDWIKLSEVQMNNQEFEKQLEEMQAAINRMQDGTASADDTQSIEDFVNAMYNLLDAISIFVNDHLKPAVVEAGQRLAEIMARPEFIPLYGDSADDEGHEPLPDYAKKPLDGNRKPKNFTVSYSDIRAYYAPPVQRRHGRDKRD